MKHKNAFARSAAAVLAAALLAGCAPAASSSASIAASASSSATAAISVTDMAGRSIELAGPATRIVAISPADCEILYAIGAGDALVGRGASCDYPEEVLNITAVESGQNLNIEQVMALEPEVIFMTKMAQTEEQVKALEDAGAKVIVSDAQDIAGVYEAIALVGAVTGKSAEAAELANSMKQGFAAIAKKATGDGSKTIYFEVSPLEYGLWAAGSGTFMDELATMLGLTNAFADVEGWGEVSQEQVIERNPDYIVTTTMYFGEGPAPEEEIAGRAGWQNITAVANGAVFNADSNETARPGPRLVNAAEALYEFVYGAAAQSQSAAA
ncbi:MAG: ABC transporter substrate-binding protein [Oscillospiraceae bacterium]